MSNFKFPVINPLLHNELRLKIMVALDSLESANFMYLCEITDSTRGNLSVQLKTLHEAGYIDVDKSGSGPAARSVCSITQKGITALHTYEQGLRSLFAEGVPSQEAMQPKRGFLARTAMMLLFAVLSVLTAWAGDVTPQQALEQARNFIQQREAAGVRAKKAPGAPAAQLIPAQQVSGLYLFNVSDDSGYVIVSNDDVTAPILGYSDSGAIDPDNMPDNMKAWLQGYADQIAWAKEHDVKKIVYDSPFAKSNGPRRVGTAVRSAIAPLISTKWNQSAPYYNLTPYYDEGTYSAEYEDGYSHCATGCVATAMAQVMKYHEWPKTATTAIPEYTWASSGITLGPLSSITFDWANMTNTYSGTETGSTAIAVATLMQYCGYSVKMDYGPESGSNTYLVADALKAYFDYNTTTTQYVQRSFYSYGDWIEMIYHELANKRPVCYGGQSSGGGHEFVIDGYDTEDFFHVNWGWGGMSDSYFKLSALDPDMQGIGGSSSTDGFHYGQDAVIGIQPSTGTGTVLNVTANIVNLTQNTVTFSANPTQYEEVTVDIDLTNNSADDYDGDIGMRVLYSYNNKWYDYDDISNDFLIPAHTSKTIRLSFIPSYSGMYTIQVYRPHEEAGYILWLSDRKTVQVAGKETTDKIELVSTITVETEELTGTESDYYFYGSTIKGSLTITNPESTAYLGPYQLYVFLTDNPSDGWYRAVPVSQYITVPAKGQISFPFMIDGVPSKWYINVKNRYFYDGTWTALSLIRSYISQPGVISYKADGITATVKPTSPFVVGNNVLAVDLIGSGVTSVTKNNELNCMYIVSSDESVPDGLTDDLTDDLTNVVTYDWDSRTYTANTITLTDGYGFYSPVDFTASKVEFTYKHTVAADGTDGWNTIMLPYDVTKVTATDPATGTETEIDWFHDKNDTGKNFWLKSFSGDATDNVYFDYAEEMTANTPYIVAFPGERWGAKWNMFNKTIKFIGENTQVSKSSTRAAVTGNAYRFIGSTVQDNTANIYCLNAAGNTFELNANGGSGPFRAYFKPGIFDRTVKSLAIGSDIGGVTTPIQDLEETPTVGEDNTVYNLAGQRVAKPSKGLYIVNGKKVAIK